MEVYMEGGNTRILQSPAKLHALGGGVECGCTTHLSRVHILW